MWSGVRLDGTHAGLQTVVVGYQPDLKDCDERQDKGSSARLELYLRVSLFLPQLYGSLSQFQGGCCQLRIHWTDSLMQAQGVVSQE